MTDTPLIPSSEDELTVGRLIALQLGAAAFISFFLVVAERGVIASALLLGSFTIGLLAFLYDRRLKTHERIEEAKANKTMTPLEELQKRRVRDEIGLDEYERRLDEILDPEAHANTPGTSAEPPKATETET
jgi:uncharacterized membrane protein